MGGDPGKIVGLVESEAKKGRIPTQLSWVEWCHPDIHVSWNLRMSCYFEIRSLQMQLITGDSEGPKTSDWTLYKRRGHIGKAN